MNWKPGFLLPRYHNECLSLHANLKEVYNHHVATMDSRPACIDKLKAKGIGARPTLLSSQVSGMATTASGQREPG